MKKIWNTLETYFSNIYKGVLDMTLPKYFDNLHVGISAITGEPRIVSLKGKNNMSDKYKTIPKEEWESSVIGWFSMFKDGNLFVKVTKDFAFCIGGKTKDKKKLISVLKNVIKALEDAHE